MTTDKPLRVFVVDDNRDAADSLAMLVKLWGHDVECGYNGTAIHKLQAFGPDVVLLDIGLPKMDGNSMTRTLRGDEKHANTLIIAVTGYHDEARRLFAKEAGFDHYLIKPVDPSVLEKLLMVKSLSLRDGQRMISKKRH
jgi:two-component system, chemotaxis family, CheB/CheR fusion protein